MVSLSAYTTETALPLTYSSVPENFVNYTYTYLFIQPSRPFPQAYAAIQKQ